MKRNRENAEHYIWGGDCHGWRLVDQGDLSVIEERVPPGRSEVRHFHNKARQCFYVLSGALEIEVESEVVQLRSGDAVEVEPGASHQVRNVAEADAVFLVISAPTTRGDRVEVSSAT